MTDFIKTQAATWTAIRDSWVARDHETVNGPGSTVDMTAALRNFLADVIKWHNIRSILDAPCGDWNWMRHVDLTDVKYTGWDVEPTTIELNDKRWPQHEFSVKNLLTARRIPTVDLIICRDFLIHLPNKQIDQIVDKFTKSGSRFLLATNHPHASNDVDLAPGGEEGFAAYWQRHVDLEAPPFSLGGRVEAVVEPNHPVAPVNEMVLFQLNA